MRAFNWSLLRYTCCQLLLGLILSWIYIIYLRHVFESHTNITQLSQFEREALFRREDALHYSFYKKVATAPTFWQGYEKLKNVTDIEYPKSVNVLKRFFIMPELIAGYIYHVARNYKLPLFSCWPVKSANQPIGKYKMCDVQAYPLQFYLSFARFMNGITIFIVYMNAILLCDLTHGGVFGMISYIVYHNYNAKAYERPAAHENFAFPVILLQLYMMCRQLKIISFKGVYSGRIINILYLTVINTAAMLFWQFTSMLFLLHVIILGIMLNVYTTYNEILFKFLRDAITAILISPFLAFLFLGNYQYFYVWQTTSAFGFVVVSLVRSTRWLRRGYTLNMSKIVGASTALMILLVTYDCHIRSVNLLQKAGILIIIDNTFTHYYSLFSHWLGIGGVQNFVTHLAACNPLYERLGRSDLWIGWKRMLINPAFLFVLVHIGILMKKLQFPANIPEFKYEYLKTKYQPSRNRFSQDHCWRAQMKLLEEMVETFKIKEEDMELPVVTQHARDSLQLLIDCNYDFKVYEQVKELFLIPDTQDNVELLNELIKIRAMKNAIVRDNLTVGQALEKCELPAIVSAEHIEKQENVQDVKQQQKEPTKKKKQKKNKKKKKKNKKAPAQKALVPGQEAGQQEQEHVDQQEQQQEQAEAGEQKHEEQQSRESDDELPEPTWPPPKAVWKLLQNFNIPVFATPPQLFLTAHYILFAVISLFMKKLCFIPYTYVCILIPAVLTRIWYYEYRKVIWIAALMIFVCAMFDCGWLNRYDVFNLHKETYLSCNSRPDPNLNQMLAWIRTSTKPNAVFAGTVDVIGTVHVATGRPIYNHAHLEMPHIKTRTEEVYMIYSRHYYHQSYMMLKILQVEYIVVEIKHCERFPTHACSVLGMWDRIHRKMASDQFCEYILQYNIAAFPKVFKNSEYAVVKLSEEQDDYSMPLETMQEESM